MTFAHFTAVLANHSGNRKQPLKAEQIWNPPSMRSARQQRDKQREVPEAHSKNERNRVISLEAERKKRLRHAEAIGPASIPVNMARLRTGKSGRNDPNARKD